MTVPPLSLYAHARPSPFAYETAGAARARHSLRPLVYGGARYGKNSGELRRGNANGRSRRQRVFDQLDPVRSTEHDRRVVEIIGGMMQSGAVAIAAEDKGAGPCFQHVGEILGPH